LEETTVKSSKGVRTGWGEKEGFVEGWDETRGRRKGEI
jgi:hypothetical protein